MTLARTKTWWGLLAIVAAVACGTSTSPAPGTGTSSSGGVVAQQTVGSAGGTFATSDGALTVAIPAGALSADTTISIEEISAPSAGAIGKTYDIGPSGTQFKTSVTLSFKYAGIDLQGHAASDLRVATIVDGKWAPLANDAVDTNTQVASGTTLHLSPYTLIAGPHDAEPGGNDDDAGSSTDAGPDDDSGATPDGGTTDSGACSKEVVGVGSCLNHPPFCTTYPGTKAGTCTSNDAGQGYSVMCCPVGG